MAKTVYEIVTQISGQNKVGAEMKKLGAAAGLTGVALLGIAKSAADAANEVERSFGNLGTLLDDPAKDTAAFREEIDGLTKTLQNTVTKADLAAESYNVVSAGFTNAADAAAVLESSQKLALVGQGSLAAASDGVTTSMNALSETFDENTSVQERAAQVSGVFAETIRLGKTNIDEMGPAIARVAPLANTLGININTLGASFAQLTADGVKTAESSTQIKAIFTALINPSVQANKIARSYGLTLNANTVKADGFVKTLKRIQAATKGNKEDIAKLLGSSEALNGFLTLSKGNFEGLDAAMEATGNSAVGTGEKLEGAFKNLADNRAVKAEATLNALSDAMVDLGEGAAIAFEPAMEALTFLIERFNDLSPTTKATIGTMIAVGGATLTTAGALVGLATAISSTVTAVTTLKTATIAISAALKAKAVAATGAATSMTALNVSTGALVAGLGLAVVALGAVAVGVKNLNDRMKEAAAFAKTEDLIQTEGLVNDLERLNNRLVETGKAIPDKEFAVYIEAAKKAATETNQLGKFVEVLEKRQASAKAGLGSKTEAINKEAQANIFAAEAAAKKAEVEKAKEFVEANSEKGIQKRIKEGVQAELDALKEKKKIAAEEKKIIKEQADAEKAALTEQKRREKDAVDAVKRAEREKIAARREAIREAKLQEQEIKAGLRSDSAAASARRERAANVAPASTPSSATSNQDSPGGGQVAVSPEGVQALKEIARSTDSTATVLPGISQIASDIHANNQNIAENVRVSVDNSVLAIETSQGILAEAKFQSSIMQELRNDVTNLQNTTVSNTNAITSTLDNLPSRIAASIPRPTIIRESSD